MNFNHFSTHDYVDPDDPLTKPHPGFVIEQQNRQISILQQKLQQSQTAYQDILEKIKSLEVDKQKKASKSQLPPLKLYKSSKLPVKKKPNNCLHKSNPYQLIIANTPPYFQYTKDSFYIHIKVLWDMVHEHSVPIAPKISMLKEFSNCFKSLPIDFYDSKWFNDCPIGEKTVLANSFEVSFLPNASQSIRGIQHPDKRLSDRKFTEEFRDKCTAPYDLSHKISKKDDDYDESIENYSKSDEEIAADKNEEESNQAEFNRVLDFDTPMAHAEDPSKFYVGGSSFLLGDEWKRDW
ncbi:hypothetical protein O181_034677 [Austropuccinia psidii MF-1]|uniref:Uncharacterized protein n=1 Tax=Austropuccinia psidii MF-1 TaxID=1389203 RepID=A0A9Q3D3Q9_9BASI|nr:hypothetical protein [Austropuccinia psidii MF-1]